MTTMDDKALRGARSTTRAMRRLPADAMLGKVIMDIGGNVGHVTRHILDCGARRVVTYEPHPAAFAQGQARAPEAEWHNAALLTVPGRILLTESIKDRDAGYHCNATVVDVAAPRRRDRAYYDVPVLPFAAELARVKPQGMKIDCEGSEYGMLLRNALPDNVEWLCVEFHHLKCRMGMSLFAAAVRRLIGSGFGLQPINPKLRPAPGQLFSFWGFEEFNFVRGAPSDEEDLRWLETMDRAARATRPVVRDARRQALFDEVYASTL